MQALAVIVQLLAQEGPAIVAGVQAILPPVIAFFKGVGSRDAVVVALDSALAAYRAEIDREMAAKHSG